MGAQAHKDTVELLVERWNSHDDRYFDHYAADAPIHGFPPDFPENVEGMRQLFHQMWAAFPDSRVDLLHLLAEADLGAAHLRFVGTHEGEFLGAAPTGNRIEVELITIARFGPDGKVAERWTRIDEVSLLTQLGLMPAPAAAPA